MAASGKHPITMSNASVPVVHEVEIIDELGRRKPTFIPGERSLTIYLDKREVVTLMTLGSAPEALVLGYLRNQRLVESPADIESIQVDWETDSAAVKTRRSTVDIDAITSKRVVTTGCGQGTMFGGSWRIWRKYAYQRALNCIKLRLWIC